MMNYCQNQLLPYLNNTSEVSLINCNLGGIKVCILKCKRNLHLHLPAQKVENYSSLVVAFKSTFFNNNVIEEDKDGPLLI